jgi:hypothetical protein
MSDPNAGQPGLSPADTNQHDCHVVGVESSPADRHPAVVGWADRIRPHLTQAAASMIAAGKELAAAKAELPHGQFGPLLDELGLSARMAQRFMRVAAHPVLGNATRVTHLPAAIGTLDELTRWDPAELAEAIDSGEITTTTTRAEAQSTRRQVEPASPATCCGFPVHPALALIPPMRPHEREGLRRSIDRWGVLVPVAKDQHGRIIDGRERLMAAVELGVNYRVDVIRFADDDDALAAILDMNLLRQESAP